MPGLTSSPPRSSRTRTTRKKADVSTAIDARSDGVELHGAAQREQLLEVALAPGGVLGGDELGAQPRVLVGEPLVVRLDVHERDVASTRRCRRRAPAR